jgi:hypothetical protein
MIFAPYRACNPKKLTENSASTCGNNFRVIPLTRQPLIVACRAWGCAVGPARGVPPPAMTMPCARLSDASRVRT